VKKLFEAARIGTLELKNRIVFLPMGTNLGEEGGFVSDDQVGYYARRAAGGAGLVIVEICSVDPGGLSSLRQPRIYDDSYADRLGRLARAIQKKGAKAAIQLQHPGRQSSSKWTGVHPVAPSPIPCPVIGEMPRELTTGEVRGLVERFAEGARRAKEIGFDAVELHGAHGYLICQFFSTRSNRRTDDYGGDVRSRARFGVEIVRRAREKVGPDYPLTFRISADEHFEDGLTIEETSVIARMLEEAGVDAISVSAGAYGAGEWSTPPMLLPVGCLIPHAAAIKKVVGAPVIAAGRLTSTKIGQKVLDAGSADFIGLGRGLLADPDLPVKSQQGRDREVTRCIACNTCLDRVLSLAPIACVLNPDFIGNGVAEEKAPAAKRVLIIGAGPAGFEAARVARLRGHEVALWEENETIGGRWAWRIHGYVHHSLNTLRALGVLVRRGVTIDPHTVADFRADVVLVTAASRPLVPPFADPKADWVFTVEEALAAPQRLGGRVAVLGGSNLACEAAEALSRKGRQVTILNKSRLIGYGLERSIRVLVTADLEKRGVTLVNNAEVTGISKGQLTWRGKDGGTSLVRADAVVLALGHEADEALAASLRRQGIEIRTLPPCESPRDVFDSMQQGAEVARQV
jgi:2,4-dienoyl-CoA reductase-like NADH-dependent reductase (Old Yellow Enzyme family)/thioredoxin reductase